MKRLAAFVAALGTNLTFVASMAHVFSAFALVAFLPSWWTVAAIALVAGVKEFVFDAREESPKQTFADNLLDWSGYLAGGFLAAWHFGILKL